MEYHFFSPTGDCSGQDHCTLSTTPLQDALDTVAAGLHPDGGKIYLAGGVFNEDISLTKLGSDLILVGVDKEQPVVINGSVQIVDAKNAITLQALTLNGNGADIQLMASRVTLAGSRIEATGEYGGHVQILGQEVTLTGTTINASGTRGGGQVNIGGSYQGQEVIPYADTTVIDSNTVIYADALQQGDGGTVIVWGSEEVHFSGTISTEGGDRGFVEISTHGAGNIDGLALTGNLLVDPEDVCVNSPSSTNDGGLVDPVYIAASTIASTLSAGGDFTINTTNSLGAGTGKVHFSNTTINVNNTTGTVGTFRIEAADEIDTWNTVFSSSGTTGTNYEFYAGSSLGTNGTPVSTADVIQGNQSLGTGGGHVIFDAADDISIGDPLLTSGGDVTLIARGGDGTGTITIGASGNTNDDHIDTTDGAGGAGTVTIQTDGNLALNAIADPTIIANGGVVAFERLTTGNISAGDDNGGLHISQTEWNKISTETIYLGSSNTTTAYLDNLSTASVRTIKTATLLNVRGSVTTSNNNIAFISDEFDINTTVNAGTGTVTFGRATVGSLSFGYNSGIGTAGADLNTSELALITAGSLVIGGPSPAQNNITQLGIANNTVDLSGNISGIVQFNALNSAGSYITSGGNYTFRAVEFNANDGVTFLDNGTLSTTVGDATFNVDADATSAGSSGFNDLRAQDVATVISSAANITVNTNGYNETGDGTLTLNANSGTGTINIQRSRSGTIGIGDGASGGLSFTSARLSRMSAGTINFGNTALAQNLTTATNVNAVSLDGTNTVNFYTQSGGTTTFSGTSNFAAVSTNGGTTTVDNGAVVNATNTLAFNTTTVNLDGNLTATGGISGSATAVNVLGSTGGAQIQDADDVAANGATIIVAAASYSPGFTLDFADLTIDGAPATGTSPGILGVNGNVSFADSSVVNVEINGTVPGTDHDQFNVTGSVDINTSASLDTSGTIASTPASTTLVIINNDGSDAVTGNFAGLPNGTTVSVNGQEFRIFYNGGDGNDVVLVENTAPSLTSFTRQTPATSPTNADMLIFRATFSEGVQNVDAADFALDGATTATVTEVSQVSTTVYDVTVSGGDLADFDGVVGLNLSGSQNIQDLVGNDLPAGEPASDETYTLDNTAPTLTSFTRQTPATSPTNVDTLIFRATLSEEVQNVDAADFTVNGATTATVTGVSQVSTSVYDVTVSGGDLADFDGTIGLNLSGSQDIADLVGNALPAGEPAIDETYTLDNTGITVTINQAATQGDPTNMASIDFTATFDEAVTDFTVADVTLGGTAPGVLSATLSGGPTVYTVTVTGMTGTGTVTAVIEAGAVTDLVGNSSTASTSTDNSVTYDSTNPTVVSSLRASASPTTADSVDFTVTFSKDVIGVDIGDFDLATSGVSGTAVTEVSGSGSVYTVSVSTGSGIGDIQLTIPASATITDSAGNALGNLPFNGSETYEIGMSIYLPIMLNNFVSAPDLVVDSLSATGSQVTVTISNQGNAPVVEAFWVDVYLNPTAAPTGVNQGWQDLGSQGLVWGVEETALPLAPGESLTLTIGDSYYWPDLSSFETPLPAGSSVYAQVDSVNTLTTYGGVLETHEISDGAYNNISGPVESLAGGVELALPAAASPSLAAGSSLPSRD